MGGYRATALNSNGFLFWCHVQNIVCAEKTSEHSPFTTNKCCCCFFCHVRHLQRTSAEVNYCPIGMMCTGLTMVIYRNILRWILKIFYSTISLKQQQKHLFTSNGYYKMIFWNVSSPYTMPPYVWAAYSKAIERNRLSEEVAHESSRGWLLYGGLLCTHTSPDRCQ